MARPFVPIADDAWTISCGDLSVPVDRASLQRRYADWICDRFRSNDPIGSPWPVDEVLRVSEPGHAGVHLMGLLTGGAGLLSIDAVEAGSDLWSPAPYAVAHHVVWIAHVPARTMRVRITTTTGVKHRTWATLQATG